MNHDSFPGPAGQAESLLGQFLRFLRRPIYTVNTPKDHQGIGDILKLYSLVIIVVLALGLISSQIASSFRFDHILQNEETISPAMLVSFGIIVAPILEEMIFRLPLRYTPLNLTLPLHFFSVTLVLVLVGSKIVSPLLAALLLVAVVSLGLLLRLWLKRKVNPKKIHTFYERFIGWLVYGSSLIFGLVHVTNFDLAARPGQIWLLTPLLVLPQIALGIFLAFVRLRYGFWWSVFTHGFHNACALTPFLLMQLLSPNLRSQLEAGKSVSDWMGKDMIVLGLIVAFVGGGLILCIRTVWQLVHEWRAESR